MSLAPSSYACREAITSTLVASSRALGWTGLLLDHHRITPDDRCFETLPTPDQTIVVMLGGEQQLEAFTGGLWRRATYRAGTVGLTPGGQVDRLRRLPARGGRPFDKVNLYIAADVLAGAAERYRRAGQAVRVPRLDALAFADPLLLHTAMSLRAAADAGAPDLYAQAAAQWLATHLLVRHARYLEPDRVSATAEAITDPRLARVLEMMSARMAEPLTLDELAAEGGISKFHFVRVFRRRTGRTPHAMLQALRLDAARRMLASGDLPVAVVACRCGFGTGQRLTTAFTRRFGLPPTRWRAAHRGDRRERCRPNC